MRFLIALLFIATAAQADLQVCPRMPVATAVANQFLTSISAAGATTLAQPSCSNLSGVAASCSTDTTNASNITTGNLPSAQLPTGPTWPTSGTVAVRISGQVIMTAATSCPTGTIAADGTSLLRSGGSSCGGGSCANLFTAISTTYGAADGTHFTLPDMRGVFARGAGTQTISAIGYTGTQGTTAGDTMQGHYHTNAASGSKEFLYNRGGGAGVLSATASGTTWDRTTQPITDPSSDGTNGTPRTGSETRPANITLLYCIFY